MLMVFIFMLSTAVSPSISMSPSCCRHVSFLLLICPFLMLSTSFSYAPWRRWDGGSPSISMSPSCRRHVSFLLLICPFLMLSPSFSYAPWRGRDGGSPSISMSPSCCRHVSFLLLICPFLMLSPSFSYAPRRTWDRHPCTRPDPFWCYPLCGACCVCPFLMLHGALSIHLHVSHVSILLSTCLFSNAHGSFSYACGFSFYAIGVFFANLSFSCAAPSSSYAPRRLWDGGSGTLLQGPTFFGAILNAELAFFMLRLSFSYAPWGAFHPSPCLSLHLHVSHPVVDMFVFGLRTLPFLCCSCPSCAPWAKGWGRGGHGAH